MSQVRSSTSTPKIVLFGQTGSGKSSLINMLAGEDIAYVSSHPDGATITPKSYDISKGKKTYTFWDTCGLNEGDKGSVPASEAANNLVDLLEGQSIKLIIYVARGIRLLNEVHANRSLFDRIRRKCGKKVPIVLVVTGLEQENTMDEWWTRHRKDVQRLNLAFQGHACVTTTKGFKDACEKEYQESAKKVWELVETHCNSLDNIILSGGAGLGTTHSPHNIILFGEAGSGKSSIVNMIVGKDVAQVSSNRLVSTFQHERYPASIGDTHFNLYDTAGLNEGEQGRVRHWKAIHELYTLIRSLDGISLLIYCFRGRMKENTRENWILFSKVLCAEKVPIIAVETGLEREENLDGRRTVLRNTLTRHGMVPRGVACISSVLGKNKEYEKRYEWSQKQLRQLVMESYKREPWSMTTDDWIGHIYQTTYTTKLCILPVTRVDFARGVGAVVDEFIQESEMKGKDAETLKSTLLNAEKQVRKASR